MGYANIQADSNFYRQSLNADGVKYVTGPYTSLYEDVFRAVTVTTDSVVSVTSYVGDSLSSEFLLAGTEIYGLFSSVTIHSGKAVLHLAGASYISEIINQYSATGIPLGFYEEGTQCLSQKISALLTQGLFDDASWVMVPSQYEEDWVRAFKPTSELGNLAFTRSSDATFTDSTGVVRRSPYNLVTFSEQFDNTAWLKGLAGTGIAPVATANTSTSPIGTLTADRVQFNCVGTTISDRSFLYQPFTSAIVGRSYTFSIYIKANAPSEVGKQLRFLIENGTTPQQVITITADWTRYTFTATSATNTSINAIIETRGTVTANTTADVLLWGAQLVEGTEALPYFATTDRLNVPRLDYRNADGTLSTCPRLLLEPQRTNSIRNSSIVGAVAGSPGTIPTNWKVLAGSGLTSTVVGIGTENGLPYIDLRYNGTASGTGELLGFEQDTQIAASNGQSWSLSCYVKLISGTANSFSLNWSERNSSAGFLLGAAVTIVPTSTLQRFTLSGTLAGGATVAAVQPFIRAVTTSGQTYDFTIRIAAPQMELGAYATTWVPTTTTAVTRIADAFTRNNIYTNGLISSAGGTWIVDLSNNLSLIRSANSGIFIGDLTTINTGNQLVIRNGSTSGSVRYSILKYISGVVTTLFVTSTDNVKIAIKWNGATADVFVNGVKEVSATSFTTTLMENLIGTGAAVPYYINQSFLAPTPLSDAECIALTTL